MGLAREVLAAPRLVGPEPRELRPQEATHARGAAPAHWPRTGAGPSGPIRHSRSPISWIAGRAGVLAALRTDPLL